MSLSIFNHRFFVTLSCLMIPLQLLATPLIQEEKTETSRLLFLLQTSSNGVTLGSTSFREFGIKPSVGFFPWHKLSIQGSYFAMATAQGQSNLNGFGLGAKYYFPTSGTNITMKSLGTTIQSYPGIVFYGGIEYTVRQLKSTTVSVDYTGFTLLGGFDWHYKDKWLADFELSYSSLQSPLGVTTIQEMKIIAISVGIGIMM